MPEKPADKKLMSEMSSNDQGVERLATSEELAEFGSAGPDAAAEAQILALLEEQMREAEPTPAELLKIGGAKALRAAAVSAAWKADLAEVAEAASGPKKKAEEKIAHKTAEKTANKTENKIESLPESVPEPVQGPVSEPREQTVADVVLADVGALKMAEAAEIEREIRPLRGNLLEFAEVLDQHRIWAESGGKEGIQGDFSGADLSEADLTGANLQGAQMQKTNLRGAELSMANFRGANLVEADLRETNLLGAEFSGANLMGANLYGAQGLWAGRLGGTNLFDATLPEAVPAHDGGKTIGQSTQSARRFYLLTMAFCAGAFVLVALTTDVRLLLDQAAVPGSRIPNVLPLQGFYLGGPLLLTILYLRMQFLLLRLCGSIGALPAVFPDGQTPEKDGSWYLMGPIRPHLRWSRDPRSPLAMVESVAAMLMAYWLVPTLLFVFWLRYLVLQDYRGTLLQVFLFALVTAGACGLPRVVARVLRPGDWTDESTAAFLKDVSKTLRVPAIAGVVLFLFSLGVIRGLPADASIRPDVGRGNIQRWAATIFQTVGFRPYADITEEAVTPSWQPGATKSAPYAGGDDPRGTGTANGGGPGDAAGPRLNEMNLRFARGYHAAFANARMWRANLEGASLSEADFRGANLREAVMRSANLDRLQAEKANLVSADARGANFTGADFRNADMSYANLEGATLSAANLSRASLYAVNLRHANLLRADLSHTDLRDVKLEEAVLSLAVLDETDFSAAKMMAANLTGVQAKGTIFLEADLARADLRGANFAGAILRQANLQGANLDGADLRGALGLEAAQVCSAQSRRGAMMDGDVGLAVQAMCGGGAAVAAQ
jgi:uncharacterized protein YjbI with pentapeptide repeats